MLGDVESARRGQDQALQPVVVADGELGRQPSAHGGADQVDLVQAQGLEEVEVMQDIVLHGPDARIVGGFPETRMVGQDHAELLGPGPRELDAVEGAAPVEIDHRRPLARLVVDGPHALHVDLLAREALGAGADLGRGGGVGHLAVS